MKGVPWLLWSAQKKIFFSSPNTISIYVSPIAQQPGQAVVLGRLSLECVSRVVINTSIALYVTCVEHPSPVSTTPALQRKNAENLKQIFPEKEYRGLSPNFHIHVSVSELYITTMELPFLLEEICGPILGIYKSLTDT
jgi:hypothetical protein